MQNNEGGIFLEEKTQSFIVSPVFTVKTECWPCLDMGTFQYPCEAGHSAFHTN